ncbi:MAG: thioredoxin domain-containing protein [Candidatus Udaeobacter sp.]
MYRLKDNLNSTRITLSAVAAVLAVIVFQSAALSATEERAAITITATDRSIGSPKAPILMVEYASLTCPPCARFNLDSLPLLKAKYIVTGKVYYVFRVFPLNPVDLAAEAMARCLPPSKYMHFIDMLYRNQKEWDPEFGATDVHGALMAMGRMAGMNTALADQCIENKAEVERATKVGEEAQKRYNITGAPAFVINGQVHVGEFPWKDLQKLLDSLAKKK